jgi:phosphate starvation-inducible PhoH-like protein
MCLECKDNTYHEKRKKTIHYLCKNLRTKMAEQILQIENVDPKDLYGPNDKYLDKVKSLFPKLKIIARGDFVKVMGDEEEMEQFISRFEMLTVQLERKGKIEEKDIEDVMLANSDDELQQKMSESDVLVFGRGGMPIKAITANQKRMVSASEHKDLVFAIGPAGTGKTYTAVALAVRALKARQVRRIILTRPAVEADEHLGFLPGDLKDKLDPYLQPLYDALRDMIPSSKLEGYIEDHTIEIAPLAFMRGRTLDHAFVILDEAQNATRSQLKMFLTRMGRSAKFIVTGDITQIDLPPKTPSGLPQAIEVLKDVKGIEFIFLDDKDVVRHRLVTDIINAYKQHHNESTDED